MTPLITQHHGIGQFVGIGFGLFRASVLIDSGVITDDGSRRVANGIGLVAMIVGGVLYTLSVRKPPTNG